MSNLFFWIIILSFVIPMAMRMYRKSVAKRNHDQSFSGRYPEQFPGAGQYPAARTRRPVPGSAGPQSKQPRDGYTQQDYYCGRFPSDWAAGADRSAARTLPVRPAAGSRPAGQPFGQPPYGEQQFNQPPYNQPQPGQQQPGHAAPEQPAGPPLPRRRRLRRDSGPGNSRNWIRSTATVNSPWRTTWPAAARS